MVYRLFVAGCLSLSLLAPVAQAQTRATDPLLDVLGIPETVAVMRREGIGYGEELAAEMLSTTGTKSWQAVVERIYDPARMEETVRAGFAKAWEVEQGDLAPLTAFFSSDLGQQVIQLEISARDAMATEEIEDAARAAWSELKEDGRAVQEPRLALISEFITANDLIDSNVVGGMNSSYEFYAGLVDGGAFEMTEDDILREVWSTEEESRADTIEWLNAYMFLAYRPLDVEDLREYVTLAGTEDGKALNRALFAGFDQMYSNISYALGRALAQQMTAEEL